MVLHTWFALNGKSHLLEGSKVIELLGERGKKKAVAILVKPG